MDFFSTCVYYVNNYGVTVMLFVISFDDATSCVGSAAKKRGCGRLSETVLSM